MFLEPTQRQEDQIGDENNMIGVKTEEEEECGTLC